MNQVISLRYEKEVIAIISIDDEAHMNTFTPEFMDGMSRAFDEIQQNKEAKVVVVHGVGNYFCGGGTKETLLELAQGKMTFTDIRGFRLLFDCELPTIAAMQGHALGGGFTFGLYADIVVMGEECFYTGNFMRYGFTPGVGACYLFPKKCGRLLGRELLFTAKYFQGRELKERRMTAKIVKKEQVIDSALKLASSLSEKPLEALKLLKQNQQKKMRLELEKVIASELDMHKQSFVQAEVYNKIKSMFEGEK